MTNRSRRSLHYLTLANRWNQLIASGSASSRAHRDLDLLVDAERLEDCLSILTARGYAVETDWLPVRVEVGAAGRGWVDYTRCGSPPDLGSGVQPGLDGTRFDYPPDCFTTGNLAGREVPCLTAALSRARTRFNRDRSF